MSSETLYKLTNVGKQVVGPTEDLVILKDVNLEVPEGESLAVLGASGSGKTTLLHLLGTLDVVSWGEIFFRGKDIKALDWKAKAKLRNREIGFVFQFHHLLPEFTTLENVAMPAIMGGVSREAAHASAGEVLGLVGLSDRMDHKVTTLSGGERQRAAIARAIVMKPKLLLADEPTGNLDYETGRRVGELMCELNRELGMTLLVVTHNFELAGMMSRRLELRSGELHARD